MSRVLAIGDTHCPAMHPAYPDFLESVAEQWATDTVVHLGDLVDNRAMNYHAKEVGIHSIEEEIELALAQCQEIYNRFPKATILMGNHDALPFRKAQDAGLSERYHLRSMKEWARMPKDWTVVDRYQDHIIDGVRYRHGDGQRRNTGFPALTQAGCEHASVVCGHFHVHGGALFDANKTHRWFGLQVGTGILPGSPYMRYNETMSRRPLLGCGVVIDGQWPVFEPMFLEDWD